MTNEPVSNSPKQLLLFDGHALAFHSWFTSYPNEVMPGFFRMLKASIRKHTPTHIIVTFDPPPPTFRHRLYPDYKANRPPAPKELLEGCELVRERLESLGVMFCTVDGYEADDLLGTLCHAASDSGFETTIVTSDLDLLQLVTPIIKVEVFSQYWPTRLFGLTAAKGRFGGIEPRNIPDYKALVGDKSDNLPGVPGIGDVAAVAVLGRFGNLDDTYKHLGEVSELPIRGAKRVHKLLSDHMEEAFLMRTLTTIVCNVPLAVNIDEATFRDSLA